MSGPPCIYGAKTVNWIWRSCVVPLLIPSHFHVKKQLKTYNVNEEQRFCEFTPVPVIMTVTWQTTSPFAYLILRDFPELIWTKQLSGWPWGAYPQPTGNLSHPSAIKSYMLVLCFLKQITIHIHNATYRIQISEANLTTQCMLRSYFSISTPEPYQPSCIRYLKKWKQRSGDIGARSKVGSTDYR